MIPGPPPPHLVGAWDGSRRVGAVKLALIRRTPLSEVAALELRDPAVVAWAAATPAARVAAAIGWDYAVGSYSGHGVVGQVVRTVKPGGVSGTRTKARYRRRARASPALVAGHRPQRGEVLAAPRPKVPVGPAAVPHLMALAPTFLTTRPEDDLRFTLRTLIDALASHARRSGR